MPYSIKKQGKRYAIVKKSSGEVVGHANSRADAQASINARMGGEHGWKPSGKKGKKRGRGK